MNTQQEQQQLIQNVIKRNNVTMAMQRGGQSINKEALTAAAFKSVMTLKGVLCQLVAVGAHGLHSGGVQNRVDVFVHPGTQTH